MAENPCIICEKYMKGIRCEEADICPVGKMKKELARLKRQNRKDGKWELEWEDTDRLERGRQGVW